MKTFETEKNNIPEGATHYSEERPDYCFAWYKDIDGIKYLWMPGNFERWDIMTNQEYFNDDDVKLIPKPETTEWNGEGLPPVGCKIKTKHGVSEVLSTSDWDGGVVTYSYDDGMSIACAWNNISWITPIETPEQRKERERLEAAYDLYCYVQSTQNQAAATFELFTKVQGIMTLHRERYLAIVDKTNYRKGE